MAQTSKKEEVEWRDGKGTIRWISKEINWKDREDSLLINAEIGRGRGSLKCWIINDPFFEVELL